MQRSSIRNAAAAAASHSPAVIGIGQYRGAMMHVPDVAGMLQCLVVVESRHCQSFNRAGERYMVERLFVVINRLGDGVLCPTQNGIAGPDG